MNRWLSDHRWAIADALKRVRERPIQFLVLIGLLSILLAIPGWLAQIWLGMSSLVPEEAVHSEAIVFLSNEIEFEERIELERMLGESPIVEHVIFIPKSKALADLSSSDGLAPLTQLAEDNPLPDALQLRFVFSPDSGVSEPSLVERIEFDPRVLSLRYYPSTRIQYGSMLEVLAFLGAGFSMLTILGVLMTVFLVSAADVVDDSKRIKLYTLLGASSRYIQRPYLYRATFLGIFAGFQACLAVIGLNALLSEVIINNLEELDSRLGSIPLDTRILLGIVMVSVASSWIGAERAMNQRLKGLH